MGRASRLKRERKSGPQDRHLLMTLTNEPFQPVRLYYSIPERASVSRRACENGHEEAVKDDDNADNP